MKRAISFIVLALMASVSHAHECEVVYVNCEDVAPSALSVSMMGIVNDEGRALVKPDLSIRSYPAGSRHVHETNVVLMEAQFGEAVPVGDWREVRVMNHRGVTLVGRTQTTHVPYFGTCFVGKHSVCDTTEGSLIPRGTVDGKTLYQYYTDGMAVGLECPKDTLFLE